MDSIPAEFQVHDDRFAKVGGDEHVERLYVGCRWAEGGTYFAAGRYLVWSDIPNDRMLRWDETTGTVGVFRQPAGYTNGHTVDGQGRLVSCEHGNRRVTRAEIDGSVTVIADRFEGKRFNSPNDVVVKSDGSIWFTDPAYGIDSDYEGFQAESEIGACHVYRVDPTSGEVRIVADEFDRPNGLAFSADESLLYIADTRAETLRVYDVEGEREDRLSGGRVFAECTAQGGFDGMRLDNFGRIWIAAHDGVHCYDPDGTLLGKLLMPEKTANIVFGGPKRNRLFICATTSLYSILLNVTGLPPVRTA